MHLSECYCALALTSTVLAAPFLPFMAPHAKIQDSISPNDIVAASNDRVESQINVDSSNSKSPVDKTTWYDPPTGSFSGAFKHHPAAKWVPGFVMLSEEVQEKWVLFFDCHPTHSDGSFIDFTYDGICRHEKRAVLKRDARFAPIQLQEWKEASYQDWFRQEHKEHHETYGRLDGKVKPASESLNASTNASNTSTPSPNTTILHSNTIAYLDSVRMNYLSKPITKRHVPSYSNNQSATHEPSNTDSIKPWQDIIAALSNSTSLNSSSSSIICSQPLNATSLSNETCTIAINNFSNVTDADSLRKAVSEVFRQVEELYGDGGEEVIEYFEIDQERETNTYLALSKNDTVFPINSTKDETVTFYDPATKENTYSS